MQRVRYSPQFAGEKLLERGPLSKTDGSRFGDNPIFKEHVLLASVCRDSFFDFVKEFWSVIVPEPPVFNWHIEWVCEELQKVALRVLRGEDKEYDLLFNMPPGSTKSTIVSQMFPAWVWTRMPTAKFICGSYAHLISLKDSIRCRDLVQNELYQKCFPGIELREDQNTKGLFMNEQGGYRFSVGVNGAVTGYHGHFLLIDDPLNPEESYSEAELKVANRWMSTTLPTRKVDKKMSVTILVQQRLHQADPSGEMMERLKDGGLRHICLPGELTDKVSPPELKERYVDGLLDPVRLPRAVLDALQTELGAYGYASQILQDPVPLGGGMFDTSKLIYLDDPPPRLVRVVRSWDKAGTQDGGAYSVGVKFAVDSKGRFGFLDVRRGQWGSTTREERIKETAEEDGDDVTILIEIEGGSGGKESGENSVRNLAGYTVITYHPTGDKEARAYPLSSQVGSGNVWVLKRAWTRDLVEELRYFPHSKYKDQVDAGSSAFNYVARKKKRVGAWK